jgi:O-antigen ligase
LGIDFFEPLVKAALLGRQEESMSLTGRIPLWTDLAPYLNGHLLQGYGYDTFWTADHIDSVSAGLDWGIREAHSSYLDAILNVGLVGALLVLIAVGVTLMRAVRQYRLAGDPASGLCFSLLVFGSISALTESGMITPSFVTFVMSCFAIHVALCPENTIPAQPTTATWDGFPVLTPRKNPDGLAPSGI